MLSAVRLIAEEIEQTLSTRVQAPFSARARTDERTSFGDGALDLLSHGGAPVGAITELVGPESSGHTTIALSLVQSFVHAGSVCAWVDVSDALAPESVAASGIDLERLLWVRCGLSRSQPSVAAYEAQSRFNSAEAPLLQPRHSASGNPHPSEGRDMPEAITTMLKVHGGLYDKQVRRERKSVATPDLPNRSVSQPLQDGEEQINSDRMPPRRGDNLNVVPGCAEPQPRRVAALPSDSWMPLPLSGMAAGGPATTSNLWQALDQALRATDLLLQNGGGFGAIVLDLGSVAPEFAWRIPLATWFRFRAACERTRVSLLVLTQHPCARSSAGLVLRLQPARMEAQNKVMTGVLYRAELERSRFSESHSHVVPIRKPPQPEHPGQWRSEAVWA